MNDPRTYHLLLSTLNVGLNVFVLYCSSICFLDLLLIDSNNDAHENLCSFHDNTTVTCQRSARGDSSNGYYGLLIVGNVLLGIGSSPMFTADIAYIEEQCE